VLAESTADVLNYLLAWHFFLHKNLTIGILIFVDCAYR
jgi:hypothetical protein